MLKVLLFSAVVSLTKGGGYGIFENNQFIGEK